MNNSNFDIKIKYIKNIISPKLFSILKKNNIKFLSELITLDINKLDSINKNIIEEITDFKELFTNNLENLIQVFQKKGEKILPSVMGNDILDSFINIVNEYFKLIKNEKHQVVIEKRFGLNGNNNHSLEEIGVFFNITRERVKQIKNKFIDNLKKLLEGETLKSPTCKINQNILTELQTIKKDILNYHVIGFESLKKLLEDKYNIIFTEQKLKYIHLLVDLFIEKRNDTVFEFKYKDNQFFIIDLNISYKNFLIICDEIISILQDNLLHDFSKINIKLNNNDDINKYVKLVLDFLISINEIEVNNDNKYILKFNKIKALPDYVFRVLKDKNKIMYYDDIYAEIMNRFSKEEISLVVNKSYLKSCLAYDKRFKNIGKTGRWGLSEWEFNTSFIIDLIIINLQKLNTPSTYDQIYEQIKINRPDILKKTMINVIFNNKDLFGKVENTKIILREWFDRYENAQVF